MCTSEFSKHWDNVNGFTMEEAKRKQAAVDEAHGVGTPTSKWAPSKIVPDSSRKSGYKVVISTKV